MYVNWIGLVVGLVVGIVSVIAFFRWGDRVNWRKVNKWKLALAVPFGTVTIGMSWPEFERGVIGAIALTFILSWVTEIGTEMAAWRADEHPLHRMNEPGSALRRGDRAIGRTGVRRRGLRLVADLRVIRPMGS